MRLKWMLYRGIMRLAHRFHWHYAPPITPDGDVVLWCKWCGLRYVEYRSDRIVGDLTVSDARMLVPGDSFTVMSSKELEIK